MQLSGDSKVGVPVRVLDTDTEPYTLRPWDQLNGLPVEEWAALKDKVRRRLGEPIEIAVTPGGGSCFGVVTVGNKPVTAQVWLNPKLIDGSEAFKKNDEEWLLRAKAEAAVTLAYNKVDLSGVLGLEFTVKNSVFNDWIDVDFDFDFPALPGFDLSLPKIKLPKLSFPQVEPFGIKLPSLFSVALPPFVDKIKPDIKFVWSTKPELKLALKDGDLDVSTEPDGAGAFQTANGTTFCEVQGFSLKHQAGKFDFTAKIVPSVVPITIAKNDFAPALLPFRMEAREPIMLAPTFEDLIVDSSGNAIANAKLRLELSCAKLVIVAKDDPSAAIAFDFGVAVTSEFSSGNTRTQLTHLRIVEPYPIELIRNGLEYAGELIRLIAAIPLPAAQVPNIDASGVAKVLERLAKLLLAAAKWLARQAGKAAGLLAGVVEAVLEAILQLAKELEKLGSVAAKVLSHIAIEVRLDPKTYKLRQIVVMPVASDAALTEAASASALGFDFTWPSNLRPSLVIDLGPESWTGIVIQPKGDGASLATDLWLDKVTGPQQSISTVDGTTGTSGAKPPRLLSLTAKPVDKDNEPAEIVLASVQRGRLKLFQGFEGAGAARREKLEFDVNGVTTHAIAIRETGRLVDGKLGFDGSDPDALIDIKLKADSLKDRLLSLFAKADAPTGGGFLDTIKQKIKITDVDIKRGDGDGVRIDLTIEVHFLDQIVPSANLGIDVSLRDLSMKITGGDRIGIKGTDREYHPLGLTLGIKEKAKKEQPGNQEPYEQFVLDLSNGNESLGLSEMANAELSFGKVSTSGKGLQFEVPTLRIGRAGFDLEANVLPEPVKLGGVDVPFRFTSGQVSIKSSRFGGGALAGAGQLPSALIGEANASIAIQLGAGSDGDVVVKAATARLDKSGDPIRCTSTRFELTITELGFDYVQENGYHFFFLLTGSAVFKPGGGEYSSGLLKNFKDVTIKLDKAPLAQDPRVLLRSISFQVKVDPPKQFSIFDIFKFELRGFGFHPASPKFNGEPAMNISGQVRFLEAGDKFSSNIEFHGLWIARPKPGSSKPQVRFDGLTVGVRMGGVDVEGTAIAVDGSMPDLYRPGMLPSDVTTEGFLANGKIDIDGWASMTAAMGFLEMRKPGWTKPKNAFFLYGQVNKLAIPIRTPVGTIYLREIGFGFGHRYTIAGINQAEQANSPQELVKILDNVSKYQGSLHEFRSWEPTPDNDDLTLALRGMLALSAKEGGDYDEKAERELPNPLLMDIVAAFRTDFTFLINLRAWVSVNYNDWATSGLGESWKSNPTMRGYLYFSVPRKEFLGRFLSDGKGYVGKHPELPKPVVDAISNTRFSATLYIRPGLFHVELGWPYELGITFGKPGDTFYLALSGGLIHRVEDASALNGIAFRGEGSVYLEGRIGGSSLGAAAVARANFALETRVLSYLSLRDIGQSFYYGYMRIDVAVNVSVEVWISFKIFGKRIRLSVGFSLHLAVSISLEAVIGPGGIGGRAHVSIGVRAFGRSLSVGIGFSFNNDKLADARAKVARFMALGLSAPIPDRAQDGQRIETNPKPEPARKDVAKIGDDIVNEDLGSEPLPREPEKEDTVYPGRPIRRTDFWAVLYPTATPKDEAAGEWYLMQLVPQDHTPFENKPLAVMDHDAERATFFASPIDRNGFGFVGHRIDLPAIGDPNAKLGRIVAGALTQPIDLSVPRLIDCPIVGDALVAQEDAETLVLQDFLTTLFLGNNLAAPFDFEEPSARIVELVLGSLPTNAQGSAQELARIGRSRTNLAGRPKREAEIEEGRSAVVSAVVETASVIAAQGAPGGAWPTRPPNDIDARDFGLTFVINSEAIEALFKTANVETSPPLAHFKVTKSDTVPATSHLTEGKVFLFNHPTRMFRSQQPKFSPVHAIEEQGLKLDWDLEPAWGDSVGAYDDPEFHLKHYRIRRTVRGVDQGEFVAEFLVKPGSAIRYQDAEEGKPAHVRLTRPEFQFIDDLRASDPGNGTPAQPMPEWLRKFLLNRAREEDLLDQGIDLAKLSGVNVLYEIVPIDNAGTSDFGQVHVVTGFDYIRRRSNSPREIVLQVAYDTMPKSTSAVDATLLLLAKEPDSVDNPDPPTTQGKAEAKAAAPKKERGYILRIQTFDVAPSGGYGADAIDDSRRRPDQESIEKMRTGTGGEAEDFLLVIGDPAKKLQIAREFADGTLTKKPEWLRGYQLGDLSDVPLASLPELTVATLKSALGVTLGNNPKPGTGRRCFMAAVEITGGKAALTTRGEWRTLSFNLVIKEGKDLPAKISSTVEILERPIHLEFSALTRQDMRVESGRVDMVQPSKDGKLDSLFLDNGSAFETVRDVRRRTAMRLEWNANPGRLDLASGAKLPPDLHRWISGFELFSVDPDIITERSEAGIAAEIAELAQPLGRVSLLPPAMLGLDPAGFGDFGRIESAYPSDTLRQLHAPSGSGATGVRMAAWYSAAETAAMFPRPSIRRSLLADPDEGMLSSLFAGGRPDAIRVSLVGLGQDILVGWSIKCFEQGVDGWGEYDVDRATHSISPPLDPAATRFQTFGCDDRPADGKEIQNPTPFSVAALRHLLQNVRLAPDGSGATADESELKALKRRVSDPDHIANVTVRIEAARKNRASGTWTVVATQEVTIDLIPRQHPVIADTLAFIQFDTWETGDLSNSNGNIYRRYSVSRDAEPDVSAETFDAYVDAIPAERDPYGWSALRTLGLAAGFRLFDTETGDYVRLKLGKSREGLASLIDVAFRRALARYGGTARDNGQPFVDILTQPWGNVDLSWFDGANSPPPAGDGLKQIESEALAVVQIALRPHPDRLAPKEVARVTPTTVRYFALVDMGGRGVGQAWTISHNPVSDEDVLFDVATTAGGLVSQRPVRLDAQSPAIEIVGNRPTPLEKRPVVAVVRALLKRKTDPAWLPNQGDLIVQPPAGAEFEWIAVEQPRVLDALLGKDMAKQPPEHAFGKFENLKPDDWASALFRVLRTTPNTVETDETVDRVAYYAGRRFSPLLIAENFEDAAKAEESRQQRAAMADRIVRFWTRFVEHCAPGWGRRIGAQVHTKVDDIFFSFGTIADPGHCRRAPSAAGTIALTVVDPERRGARRKLTVRPYGRYESWASAAGIKQPVGLAGAFGNLRKAENGRPAEDIGLTSFVDTTLHRTDPLEKPVILSSVSHPPSGKLPGRFELVVAHGSDMVLAQANRRNAALLAPLDINVGFWREFGHVGWLNRVTKLNPGGAGHYKPMAPFGSTEPRPKMSRLELDREQAAQRLGSLRERVPDAWLGSTMISATHLPYFFRTHALVHASAGVVVSEQVSTTFEEGFSTIGWAHSGGGYRDRETSKPHRYGISRDDIVGPGPKTRIRFDIAAIRFIDCMALEDAILWFGETGNYWSKMKLTGHMPEPGVSYRISVDTPLIVVADESSKIPPEVLARTQEFDVLPTVPAAAPEGGVGSAAPPTAPVQEELYLVQQSGSRFASLAGASGQWIDPSPVDEGHEWRIAFNALLATDPAPLMRAIAPHEPASVAKVLDEIGRLYPPPAGLPPAIAGLCRATLYWSEVTTPAKWQVVIDALAPIADSPEAVSALQSLRDTVYPNPTTDARFLTIEIGYLSSAEPAVFKAMKDLADVEPDIDKIESLLLRRPPTDGELAIFEKIGPKALSDWVKELSAEQLFGRDRRLGVAAMKGDQSPIYTTFERSTGT